MNNINIRSSLRKAKKEYKELGAYLWNTHDKIRLIRDTSKLSEGKPKKFPHRKWAVSKSYSTKTYTDYEVRGDIANTSPHVETNDGRE